jgi:beta-mannosidase
VLRAAGQWNWDSALDFDADDWWFRCTFEVVSPRDGRTRILNFDGLATIAEVWLNGHSILTSASMWLSHAVDASPLLQAKNELVIRCSSLRQALAARRPRPRWRTRIVDQQQLRWFRTTLVGRMPGWSPTPAAVGPWRSIELETRAAVAILDVSLRPAITGNDGTIDASVRVACMPNTTVDQVTITSGTHSATLSASRADPAVWEGRLTIPSAERWWPHTHGTPVLHDVAVSVTAGRTVQATRVARVGFRELSVDRDGDGKGFGLRMNGTPVFARGTCWAPLDAVTLDGTDGAYREALELARRAGFNMIRVGGTMTYESDAFYSACDELGILVWQDFMFANMDYPATDPAFVDLVQREVTQFLQRHAHRPSLGVLCGGSEVEQQAAMLGLDSDAWRGPLHTERFPEWCSKLAPDVPYVSNSPSGGPLPFIANEGITHYYGVGAYLRPLEDARRAGVRFTTECLGFANVPEPSTIEHITGPGESPPHHPRWKARVPRDRGAGWDFDDIRDHYFAHVFGVDPLQIRYADAERYLALSRIVTGEVMARTIAEWRRPGSGCRGALVWMHRDLWPAAGWGVVDSTGLPKAAYWMLARACAPTAVFMTDEGVNGIAVHVVNDAGSALDAELELVLWRGAQRIAEGREPVTLSPGHASTRSANAMLRHFTDVSYAYRFGPAGHDLVTAELRDRATGSQLSEAFHFPVGLPAATRDLSVVAEASARTDGAWTLSVRADTLALSVAIDIEGFMPSDSYFHVAPGATRKISLAGRKGASRPSGNIHPLNAEQPTRIVVRDASPDAPASRPGT